MVDVDWYVESDQKKFFFDVDKEKAAYHGISTEAVSQTVRTVLGGTVAGLAHIEKDKEPVELYLRAPLAERVGCVDDSGDFPYIPASGASVPLSELVRVREGMKTKPFTGRT